MPSAASALNSITTRFRDNFEGMVTRFPNDGQPNPATGIWCRLAVINGEGVIADIASKHRIRTTGVFYVQVFNDLGMGTADQLTTAQLIADVFEAKTLDNITFQAATIRDVGQSDKWHQVNVEIPFWYDKVQA